MFLLRDVLGALYDRNDLADRATRSKVMDFMGSRQAILDQYPGKFPAKAPHFSKPDHRQKWLITIGNKFGTDSIALTKPRSK